MPSKSRREWVKERVSNLRDGADELKECAPDTYNSFGTWSALKLILHAATVNMYTKVISDYKDDFFYIDALAGSGVSVYGDEDIEECFFGSPILAARNADAPFTKMYFIEEDDDKANALESRLKEVFSNPDYNITPPDDYQVLRGDANKKLDEVVSDMWEIAYSGSGGSSFNHLSFIDNQGLNVTWEGISKIAPKPTGDLLINFPTSNIVRAANHKKSRDAMNDFYGGQMWDVGDPSKSQLRGKYCERLTGVEKEAQVIANVDSGVKSYEYDIIYGTRVTTGGSGYIDAVKYVKDFIEAVDGADVEDMLKVIRGDRTTMDDYLPDENGNEDDQTSLGDF
jgi:three-Cys-motif partner protein